MSNFQVVPAQHGDFGYEFCGEEDDNISLLRHPLIGFAVQKREPEEYEARSLLLPTQVTPICTTGTTLKVIHRYDGSFIDAEGEHVVCYSLIEMMGSLGYEPVEQTPPPEDPKELSNYVWQPIHSKRPDYSFKPSN